MDTQQIFDLMEKVNLGYSDMRRVMDSASPAVQNYFWWDAYHAYEQAAYDPHKWKDPSIPRQITEAIEALPVFQQFITWAEAEPFEQEAVDLFIKVYERKWGAKPESHLVERERENFRVHFVFRENYRRDFPDARVK